MSDETIVWHPVWSKPNRKAAMLGMQKYFNAEAKDRDFGEELLLDLDEIYYYAPLQIVEEKLSYFLDSYREDDALFDGLDLYFEQDPAIFYEWIYGVDFMIFVPERILLEELGAKKVYSPQHQCHLIHTKGLLKEEAEPTPSLEANLS